MSDSKETRSREGMLTETTMVATIGIVAGVLGVTALVFGAVLYAIDPSTSQIGIFNAVFAVAAIAFYGISNRSSLSRALGARSIAIVLLEIVLAIGGLGVVVAANVIAHKSGKEWDLTEGAKFTLADQSVKVAKSLKTKVKVIGFLGPQSTERARLQTLLELYRTHSDQIELELIDPKKAPPDIQEKYEITSTGSKIVVVGEGERRTKIKVPNEELLTNAIVQVAQKAARKVYVLTGHGEPSLEDGQSEEGLARSAKELRDEGYLVEKLELLSRDRVPEDAAAVLLVAPRSQLFPNEVEAISSYLAHGGRVTMLLDVGLDAGVDAIVRPFGIDVGDNLVVDPDPKARVEPFGPDSHAILKFEEHAITSLLRGSAVFLYWARSVAPVAGTASVEPVTLFSTGATSWAERKWREGGDLSKDEDDLPGPVPVAVASKKNTAAVPNKTSDEARIVVFGDASFASNRFSPMAANADLFANAINWTVGDDAKISIRPREVSGDTLILTEVQLAFITFVSVNLFPLLIVGFGFSVWAVRRRK
ncbi:MAG: GldG family protein [Deltaproteobacteria bacterium]|nr:GldG family protein [Deltaproteobacteria bacterium]